tara:strand:+ start:295 stop:429 length:135 start_codon:yes stop_codon:yes gene_type:complete
MLRKFLFDTLNSLYTHGNFTITQKALAMLIIDFSLQAENDGTMQ